MGSSPDIIVIGGGVIGLSCAWRLSQQGAKVLILEQDGPIPGASQSSLGVLAYPTPLRQSPFLSLHRRSLDLFPHFTQELEQASNISIEYTHCGSLEILPTESQHEQAEKEVKVINAQRLKVNGEPAMELLSTRQAKQFERETISTEYGALLSRMTARITVEKLLLALRTACIKLGVEIKNGCHVSAICISRDRVRGISCGEVSMPCEKVLAATGVWTSQLHPLFKKYAHIQPVRGQAIMVQTERPLIRSIVKWNQKYIVPLTEHLYALGSTTEKESGFSTNNTPEGIQQILTATTQAVPALSGAGISKFWAALRPAALDSKPIVGKMPDVEGLFVASGHYKTGFGFAPLTSQAVAELMTSGESEFELACLLPRLTEPLGKKKNKNGSASTACSSDVSDGDL